MNNNQASTWTKLFHNLAPVLIPFLISALAGLIWAEIALFMKVEYMQGRLYEQKGELMSLQSNEKDRAISLAAVTQELSDISQRLVRIENKLDASR